MLYLVATPIGNLKDITLRALEILKSADLIVCEDTRHSSILLREYEIKRPTESFHAHSNVNKEQKILQFLREGKTVALICDAGMPGISDPGYTLIKVAIEEGIKISVIPGPSAFLTGLAASGLPTDKFFYLGFLPLKKGRQTLFEALKNQKYTTVFYESPHRIERTLEQLQKFLGAERKITVARELTKIHEEFFRGNLAEACEHFKKNSPRGEFVIILEGVK